MRHGQPASGSADPGLSPLGRSQALEVSRALRAIDLREARVLHSGLRRARETAEIASTTLGLRAARETRGIQPDDDAAAWLSELSLEGTLVVVSHQPFLSRLAAILLSGNEGLQPVDFRPATAAVLSLQDDTWSLERVIDA